MATTTIAAPRRAKVQTDRYFFSCLCLLTLVVVWLGFSKTYYGVGMVNAPLPAPVIHVHAVIFTLWLLTLIVQTALVSARKVKLHMTVGLWGFGLACIMPVIGTAAAVNGLRRDIAPIAGIPPLTFFVVPVSAILTFCILAGFAYKLRRRPDYHKRLIMIATFTLLDAAYGRFPNTVGFGNSALAQILLVLALPALIVLYDLITLRRIHFATWTATLFLAFEQIARIPLAQTAPWQAFAKMIHG